MGEQSCATTVPSALESCFERGRDVCPVWVRGKRHRVAGSSVTSLAEVRVLLTAEAYGQPDFHKVARNRARQRVDSDDSDGS